jgi:hypothetical protein
MVTAVSSRDAVIAGIGRSDFSIMAARRSSLFLTRLSRPNVRKRDLVILFRRRFSIAIVMVVTDSGIASAVLLTWSVVSG